MVVALMHETFDTASHFEVTNADGIVPFFTDGYSDYFGIHNGVGTSAFKGAPNSRRTPTTRPPRSATPSRRVSTAQAAASPAWTALTS